MTPSYWLYVTFVRWPRSVIWVSTVLTAYTVARLLGAP